MHGLTAGLALAKDASHETLQLLLLEMFLPGQLALVPPPVFTSELPGEYVVAALPMAGAAAATVTKSTTRHSFRADLHIRLGSAATGVGVDLVPRSRCPRDSECRLRVRQRQHYASTCTVPRSCDECDLGQKRVAIVQHLFHAPVQE